MRALAREIIAEQGNPGHDYVLIARKTVTTDEPFDALRRDLFRALDRVKKSKKR